jgi:autotransporter-associated beta strand protein
MKNILLSGLSSLLLPMSAYAGTTGASYQRNYLSSTVSASTVNSIRTHNALPADLVDMSGDQLDIQVAQPVRELVIVDGAVAEADKLVLRRALKPGVEMVQLHSAAAGLPQLIAVLQGYKNLAAIHIVSHAEAGVILLGNSQLTAENIQREVHAFAALHGAVREGGDLLFYGCDLAANEAGEELLDIISNKTGLDVAASNNLTGSAALDGDWDLEVKHGNIEAELAFSDKALADFSEVLVAGNGTKTFSIFSDSGASLTNTDFVVSAANSGGSSLNVNPYVGDTSIAYIPNGGTETGSYFYVKADGTNTTAFELTGLNSDEYGAYQFTNVKVVGILQSGSPINSSTLLGAPGTSNQTFVFGSTELSAFSGQKLKGFKLYFECQAGPCVGNPNPLAFFEFRSFTIQNAVNTPPAPTVTDAKISISGASGTGGAYKIGDTVTATWNNTAGGDNNSGVTGVTVDFSQFGGGAAVAATNSAGSWSATYTITAGAIDATNRNVSVTATNGLSATTADTTNATVDNIAPTITDAKISISGASGTGGAYIIGDTVTATWNNTAGGDNNTDTISGVTVNFSTFGGGAAVAASNSSGTWTATYTIVSGAIDSTNLNISVTTTDNAGNTATAADSTNATVDNAAPTVTDGGISISGASGTGGAYKIGDTLTASWDNSGSGDNNTDTISGVTVDFSQFGGGAAVAATNSANTWTATYTLVSGAIDATNRNVSVTATDNAGNNKTTSDSTNATVDTNPPSVSSIAVSGSPAGNANTMDFVVSFDESVSNISTDDFALVTTGTAAGTIASVSTASGASVNVTINTISGTGTLKLNLNGATNIADDAGNSVAAYSAGATHSVDLDAPAAPSTPDLTAGSDTGASSTDNVTGDTTPTFTGTAEVNATVAVISSVDGSLGTTTADGSGNWTYTSGVLSAGAHDITATATDAAGNLSSASSALTITIDTTVTLATVTTNSDAGADATIDTDFVTDAADGGGLSLREAMFYIAATGTVDFDASLSGATFTLGSNVTIPAGITLDTDALGTATITANALNLAGNLTLTNGSGDSLTVASSLAGAGALTKTGAGKLTLTSTDNSTNYSGGVTVSDGVLLIGSDSAFSSGTLTLAGGSLSNINPSSFNFDNPIVLGAGNGTVYVLGAGNTVTLSGNISGTGALFKASGGTMVLSGTNTFSGGLTVRGTNGLSADSGANLGTGAVTIGASSVLTFTGSGQTITNAIVLEGDESISNANAITLSGVISDSGFGGLTKTGAGVLTLSGNNTATGTVTIAAGGLTLSGGSALANTVAVTVDSGATLTLPSGSETIGSLAGAGSLVMNGALTLGGNNSSTTLSGVASGTGSLTKSGTGAFTLTGTSSYTGATQVSAGSLIVNGAIATSSDVSVASGATLGGTGTLPSVAITSGGNLSPGDAGTGILTLANGLTINSGGNLLLDIAGTTAGTQYDQLDVSGAVSLSGANITATHSYAAADGDSYTLINNDNSDAILGNFASLAEAGILTAAGNSTNLIASYVAGSGNDFTLTASLLPGAPTGVSAAAGNGSALVSFSAPASNGGSAITGYTVTANPGGFIGTGAGSPIAVSGLTNGIAYTFSVTATNTTGTGSASAASNIVTPQGTQTINFPQPANRTMGDALTVTATASSGLTAVFSSSTTAICKVTSGGVVTLVAAGSCTLKAIQSGDASYLAAPPVSRSFTINAAVPGAPSAIVATAGDASASVSFTAPADTGGAAITSYTVTASPGGASATAAGSPITISGLTNGTAYSFRVSAKNSAGVGALSVASNSVTPVGSQTITFADPGEQTLGSALTLTASVSSGLTPVFSSSTPAVCTVTPVGVVTLASEGTCTLNADQAGNSAYGPAPTVSRSFAVLPIPNRAPVILQGASTSVTMSEDGAPTAFALLLEATDADSDSLSWSVSAPAQHGTAVVDAGGAVTYVPQPNFNGGDNFVVQVSDGEDSASISVNVTVEAVNDLPVIGGTPNVSVDQDVGYSFTPMASDVDSADVLTFSITNKPAWASFNTATGRLSGTPAQADAGTHGAIVISVSDGIESVSLQEFAIEVIATVDPLQPVVTAPNAIELNATGLYTPVTLRQLLSLASSASQAEINQILNGMASDGVSGNACCTANPEGLNATNILLLTPGRHEVKWKATNAVGVTGETVQVVNLHPLVSLSKSQIAVRGSEVEFRVILNGSSPTYPVQVPYVVDAATTASSAEHNLVSGVATLAQNGQLEATIPVQLAALSGLGDSQLVIKLGDGVNAGAANTHTIDIREGNVPPLVSLQLNQGGVNTSLVAAANGSVTVTAKVTDPNTLDTHSFDWIASASIGGSGNGATFTFDPAGLTGGHQIQVIVTDSGGAVVQASIYFQMVASLPVLDSNTDSDNDGINDLLEGYGDDDNNGIPNYLDNMPSQNILPQVGNTTNSYLLECDPGVRCGLGLFARGSNSGGVQILNDELGILDNLVIDPAFEPVGGIFDFSINDLPTPGQTVRIAIPQQAPVPADAVYRKYQRGQWVSFISNANNSVYSAAGSPGYCPPPGSVEWVPGLTQGHMCVQLTIEDGGPNDDDGLVNGAVVDPGGVSVAKKVVEPPVTPKPPVQVKSKGGGAMDGLWLLLLGALVLLRRLRVGSLLMAAFALVSMNTQAADLWDNNYVRADIYSVDGSQTKSEFSAALIAAGHNFALERYDVKRSGYQLAVGHRWNGFTYTELGYLDLGDVDVELTLDGESNMSAFATDFAKHYPVSAAGASLVQGVSFNAGKKVKVAVEAGVFIWQSETDLSGVNFTLDDDNGIDPLGGVRVDFRLAAAFTLGVGIRRIYFNQQEADMYSVGSSIAF